MVKLFKNLIILTGSILIGLIMSEMILRVVPGLRNKYSREMFITKFSPLLWLESKDAPSVWRSSDLLGHERMPKSASGINSYGLIGNEFNALKPKNVYRILILGDSIAQQNYFVDILRGKLNNLNLKIKFELINAGVGSYQLWHYARFLKERGIKFDPDMVLVSSCLDDANNDIYTYYRSEKGIEIYKISDMGRGNSLFFNLVFLRHSYLYRLLILNLENIFQKRESPDLRLEEAIINWKMIKNICQAREIPLFVFVWPYLSDGDLPSANPYTNTLFSSLERTGIDYIDLDKIFPKNKKAGLREWKDDPIHPSREGHAIAAEAIFNQIKNRYLKQIISKYE